MLDLHTSAIAVHTAGAVGAFAIGLILISKRSILWQTERQLGRALLVSLIIMEVFLITAILSHFISLATITQIIFGGLSALGAYMIWRAIRTVSILRRGPDGNQLAIIDDVGFILISLFDGFAIISAIDLQLPVWLVSIIAIGAVLIGIFAVNTRKKRLIEQRGKI